jgi:hypothetical protein
MDRPQTFDLAADRRFATLDRALEGLEDEPELRRELVRVHRSEAYRTTLTAIESQLRRSDSHRQLRLIPDNG